MEDDDRVRTFLDGLCEQQVSVRTARAPTYQYIRKEIRYISSAISRESNNIYENKKLMRLWGSFNNQKNDSGSVHNDRST